MSTTEPELAFAQSWIMQPVLDPETGEPLPLATHAPLLYVDDAAPLVLDPVTVQEMRRFLRQVSRVQRDGWLWKLLVWMLNRPGVRHISNRLHRNRLWRASHPRLGILVHERTILLFPLLVMTLLGFIITATA